MTLAFGIVTFFKRVTVAAFVLTITLRHYSVVYKDDDGVAYII